jgi:hypothetical protein
MASPDSDKLVVLKAPGAARRAPSSEAEPAGDAPPRLPGTRPADWLGLGAAAVTFAWLALALRYFYAELGWAAFDGLLLHEKAQLVVGVATPVAALWLAAGRCATWRATCAASWRRSTPTPPGWTGARRPWPGRSGTRRDFSRRLPTRRRGASTTAVRR